jgi:hypothetical protein
VACFFAGNRTERPGPHDTNIGVGLLEELTAAGQQLPPSHVPGSHDVIPLLGAVVAYLDRGRAFLTDHQAGADPVTLVSGQQPDEGSGPAAGPAYTVLQGTVQPDPIVSPAPDLPVDAAPALPAPAPAGSAPLPAGDEPLTPDEVAQLQSLLARVSATEPPYVTTEPAE